MEKVIVHEDAVRQLVRNVLDGKTVPDSGPPIEPVEDEPVREAYSSLDDEEEDGPKKKRVYLDPKLRGQSRADKPGRQSVRVMSKGAETIPYLLKKGASLKDLAAEFIPTSDLEEELQQVLTKLQAAQTAGTSPTSIESFTKDKDKLESEIRSRTHERDGFYKKLVKLNPNAPAETPAPKQMQITAPGLSLKQIGYHTGLSGSGARLKTALAMDQAMFASPEHGGTPELMSLMDQLRDAATFEFQQALEPWLAKAFAAYKKYVNALVSTGELDQDDIKALTAPGNILSVLNLPGFQGSVGKPFAQTPLSYVSPTGKTLQVKPTKQNPKGVRVIDAITAFVNAGGNLETGEVDEEELELQAPVREWLGQIEYFDWIRNVAEKLGLYIHDPETGRSQF